MIYDKENKKLYKSGHVLFNEVILSRVEVDPASRPSTAKGAETVCPHNCGADSTAAGEFEHYSVADRETGDGDLRVTGSDAVQDNSHLDLADSDDDGEISDVEVVAKKRGRPPREEDAKRVRTEDDFRDDWSVVCAIGLRRGGAV